MCLIYEDTLAAKIVYLLDSFIRETQARSCVEAGKMQRELPVTQGAVTMAVVLLRLLNLTACCVAHLSP